MKKHLSWKWDGVEFKCLYVAPFDPVFGAEARHIDEKVACATVKTLVECLTANVDAAAEVWRHLAESQGLKDTLTAEHNAGKRELRAIKDTLGLPPTASTEEAVEEIRLLKASVADLTESYKELAEIWDVVGGPPEHPEEDPEVSTLPAAVRVTVEYERQQLELAHEHLKAVEKERNDYKLAADTWQANALRDGAALEKVRKRLGTTAAAEKVPEVLDNMLKILSRPCGEDAVQPERASAEEVRDYLSRLAQPVVGDSCPYRIGSLTNRCRRRGGHSGPHTSSLNEARRLDAVVTHEDLKKLRDELIEALDEVTVDRPHSGFVEIPAGFRELAQILRARKS